MTTYVKISHPRSATSKLDQIILDELGNEPIQCNPVSIFSWNYNCQSRRHRAQISINWIGEQGSINIDGESFTVRKHGFVYPSWSLHHATSGEIATATSSGFFQRRWSVTDMTAKLGHAAALELAPAFFGSTYTLLRSGREIAEIAPQHLFTRKSTITPTGGRLSVASALFCFYLVAVNRRRQSNG